MRSLEQAWMAWLKSICRVFGRESLQVPNLSPVSTSWIPAKAQLTDSAAICTGAIPQQAVVNR